MAEAILGISAFFHDSAAVLLIDGKIIAAAQEERFSRIKNDASFPINAITYVLKEAGLSIDDLSAIAYFEKPLLKFERLLETYHAFAPRGLPSFLKAMPVWLKDKLFFRKSIKNALKSLGKGKIPLYFSEHHLSHAASAFFPSPFENAAILTIDGVGEWATLTIAHGKANDIDILQEQHFPHSLGLLYSAFTYYLGFEVNTGEYKVMGLAAFGDEHSAEVFQYIQKIKSEIVDIREDGSFLLNMDYFNYTTGLTMTQDAEWQRLFKLSRRLPEDPLTQQVANFALAIQTVTEEIVQKLAKTALKLTKSANLVMAGGVALNGVANGKIEQLEEVENLWIQPAAGDAGGALGAALALWYIYKGNLREVVYPDAMRGSMLGPSYTNNHVEAILQSHPQLEFTKYPEENELIEACTARLVQGDVVGWFQGRMEFGPRALGNRSILGDPRNGKMQQIINQKIKFRESFRPFAPSVLEEDAHEYFDLNHSSPYMLLVKPISKEHKKTPDFSENLDLQARLHQERSTIPAVTHVDYTSRIQTVNAKGNSRYYNLIKGFKEKTGIGILINTSFNIKDEPIVCSPKDAINCFLKTKMDVLIIENYVVLKKN
ncbi:MAG: carbamoyltransferase [Leeuwenhoekiella sp.]